MRLLALALILPAGPASGQWQPPSRTDLADLARRDAETLNLRSSGDFDGDGRSDRAYVQRNSASLRYRVLICLSRPWLPCEERIVASGPLAHLATLGIATLNEANLLPAFVRSEAGASLRGRMRRSPAPDFLEVFAFEASSTVYVWSGDGFEPVPVAD